MRMSNITKYIYEQYIILTEVVTHTFQYTTQTFIAYKKFSTRKQKNVF